MNAVKEKTRTDELLGELYKNVKMGADSLIDIMSRAGEKSFREELTAQLARYEEYAARLEKALTGDGVKPKQENIMARMSAKVGMAMNTMTDSSISHLAQMVIEGATMGTTELTRLVREYENTNCSEEALKLARDIIKYEEATIESMKKYL